MNLEMIVDLIPGKNITHFCFYHSKSCCSLSVSDLAGRRHRIAINNYLCITIRSEQYLDFNLPALGALKEGSRPQLPQFECPVALRAMTKDSEHSALELPLQFSGSIYLPELTHSRITASQGAFF